MNGIWGALFIAWTKASFLLGVVLGLAALMTWAERKQSALMQDRIGANRADILGFRAIGLFHIIADAIKMLTKEDFIPPFADKWLFRLAPIVAAFAATIGFALIPFGPTVTVAGTEVPLSIVRSDLGMLLLFGALGLTIYGTFIAGAVSGNKWGLMGAARASAQVAAYEAGLALSLAGVFMVYGTLDLGRIADAQRGALSWAPFLPNWGLFAQPFAFLLFTVGAMAETKRVPFDLPEGESEIIGYGVEYSGMRFGLFFMSELIETILFSALIVLVFFGGWHFPGLDFASMPWWKAAAAGSAVFWAKVAVGCWFFLLVRWTLPRFRYDQLLDLGWRWLLPLALLNAFATAGFLLWRGSGPG